MINKKNTLFRNFKPSEFTCEQERLLVEFCKKNGISFKKNSDNTSAKVDYNLSFETPFLDKVERSVVEFCKENNIHYNFLVDENGIHHYEFERILDFRYGEDERERKINPSIYSEEMPKLKRIYHGEVDMDFDKIKNHIQYLEDSVDPLKVKSQLMPKNRFLKFVFRFVPFSYRNRKKIINNILSDYNVKLVKNEVEKYKKEMLKTQEMLILTGIIEAPK